jgi:hypothetical protein
VRIGITARYEEQCEAFPRTREIPLELYIRRNLRAVIQNAERAQRKAEEALRQHRAWLMCEVRRLALIAVKDAIRARGDKLSLYSHASLVAMADANISPFLVAQAKANLAQFRNQVSQTLTT